MKSGWKKGRKPRGDDPEGERFFVWLLAVMALSVGVVLFLGMNKKGYFIDELYSYGLANGAHTDIEDYGIYGRRIDLEEENPFLSYLTVDPGEAYTYGRVYKNQIEDVHPPLYYVLLHTVCSLFFPRAVLSKWQGIFLNIVFLLIILFLLYKIGEEMFQNKGFSMALCGLYGVSAAALGMTLYIRMYALLTALSLAYFYLHLLLHRYGAKKKLFLGGALLLYFGLLTQYHFLLFAFFTSAFYSLFLWKRKAFKDWFIYGAISAAALFAAYWTFPFMLVQLSGDQNTYVRDLMETGKGGWLGKLANQIISFISFTNYSFFGGRIGIFAVGTGLFCLLLLLFSLRRKKPDKSMYGLSPGDQSLFVLSAFLLGNIVAVGLLSWVPALRYYYHTFPLLALAAAYGVYRAGQLLTGEKRLRTAFYGLVGLMYLGCGIYGGLRSLDAAFVRQQGAAVSIPYLYPGEDRLIHALLEPKETDILLLTEYKNASVTH